MVWNSARTAVVPKTTSPSAVKKTIRAIRPTGIADDRQDESQGDDKDEEMPEPHGNGVPLLSFLESPGDRPPTDNSLDHDAILHRLSTAPAVVSDAENW